MNPLYLNKEYNYITYVLEVFNATLISNNANKQYARLIARARKSLFHAKNENNGSIYGMINMFFGEKLSS